MTKVLSEPPALVVRAESIDGVKALAVAVMGQYREQRKAMDRADAHGLEIGRLICEFAERPEVSTKLAIINAKENRPGGGRPKAAHCWVAEQIAAQAGESSLSVRHLERCARAFLKAKAKGLPLGTSIRVAEASAVIAKVADRNLDECQPSPERLFDTDTNAGQGNDGDRETFDPEREANTLARKIRTFFYTPEGHPRLRTRKQKDAFASHLNKQFEVLQIDWVIEPKGGQ